MKVVGRKKYTIVALLSIAIIIPTFFIGGSVVLSSNLEWKIEVGDKFTYHVLEEGWKLIGGGVTSNRTIFEDINDTIIIATVTALPDIGFYIAGEVFVSEIVSFEKNKYSI
ncbi:MAG: hypothetical protein P1Q69_08185 [Candidatus Thorarchaeota archaeon]|nr:hypothetical protein [Candidatus Thorarchaeota archaeon]